MKSAAKLKPSRELELRPRQPHPPVNPLTRTAVQPALASRWRLLVVTDELSRLVTWQAALPASQWDITGLTTTEWAQRKTERPYDLALLDVPAEHLAEVLVGLRGADWQMPILVEASRLPHDRSSAGVLPLYRAFPGTQAELLRFMRNRWLPVNAAPRTRRLL